MRKLFFNVISIIGILVIVSGTAVASSITTLQMEQGTSVSYLAQSNIVGDGNKATNSDDHTAREEAEGKLVWEKLQTKQTTCADLSDEDFGALGEYFMGLMMGEQHEAMNNRMIQMMGEVGEEQMHVAMGKRFSGCDTAAPVPQNMMNGMMPIMSGMMGGMMAGYPFEKGGDSQMMGNFGTYGPVGFFGFFGMLIMIIFWILVIVAIVALIRWLIVQGQGSGRSNHALDILKERYAKGEINKEEFESKKRDLS